MDATIHQAQLPDGRWVRMRELSSLDQERATAAAGIAVGRGTVDAAAIRRQTTESIKMALTAVSAPKPLREPVHDGAGKPVLGADRKPALERFDPAKIAPGEWKPLSYGELETSYDALFGAKARVVLQRLYDHIHIPSEEEMDGFFETIRSGVVSS